MAHVLNEGGARIDAFYYCSYHPEGSVSAFRREHEDKKPAPGMLLRAIADWNVDPEVSLLIGDRSRDGDAARSAGVTGFSDRKRYGDLAEMVRQADLSFATLTVIHACRRPGHGRVAQIKPAK